MGVTRNMLKRLGYFYGPDILFLKRIIYGIIGFAAGIIIIFIADYSEKKIILTTTYDLYESIPYGSRQLTEEELSDIIIEYKDRPVKELTDRLRFCGVTNENTIDYIVEKAKERYTKYEGSYIKWQEILIQLIITLLFYNYPYLFITFKYQFLEDYMAEEVMCFRTIITMQVNLIGINIIELLESMEMFSNVFQPSIQVCINSIICDERKALNDLKENESYPPFVRLVDCFLLCDKTEVSKAFDEVMDDIRHFQEVYSMELEIGMKKKSDIAELISFLPGVFILFFYLIIPFISAGMTMFEMSFEGNLGNTIF